MRQIIQLHTDDEKIVSAYPLTLSEAVIVDSATTLDQEIESLEDATKCAAAALYKLNNEKLSKAEADAVYAKADDLEEAEYVTSQALNNINTRVDSISGSVESKADIEDVYTKEEADERFVTSGDVYTKSETDEIFATKQELYDVEEVVSYSLNDLNTRVEEVSGSVESKADIASVYTKEEADERFVASGDVYTKSESDEKFTTKEYIDEIELVASQALNDLNARVSTISGSVETKASIEDVYTKDETDTLLGGKANSSDVYAKSETYSKTEVDEKFVTSGDVIDIEYVISQALNNLNTRVDAVSGDVETKADANSVYEKSETYTQTETDNAITTAITSAISGKIEFRIVESLPTSGESSVIYLVPKTTTATQNEYDEYAWINNKWELIGKTDIDLSQYALLTNLTDGSVTKVGTTTVGGNGNPIYLNDGIPTELTIVDKATKDAIGNTISEYYTPISSHNTLSGAVEEIKVDVDEMDIVVSRALVNLDDRIKNISASTSEVISSLSSRVDTIDSSITSLSDSLIDLRSDFDELVTEYSGASRTIAQSLVDLNTGLSNKANTSFVGSGTIGSGSATFDTIVEAVNWLIQQQLS